MPPDPSTAPDPNDQQTPSVNRGEHSPAKLGNYELLGELGRGSFGVVYRARDPRIKRLVAVKTLNRMVSDNPSLLERFYREAQSAGSLQHPNIVTIYDMGEDRGTPFIAMELVDGSNFEHFISQHVELALSLKLAYAVQACRAFDYAHKRGIVHRDIKPANVMLNKEGVIKVVDFGIARILETSNTQTGTLIGTFSYMAPELFRGEHATERSDIWSFGVLLYELVAYETPFAGESPGALMQSVCRKEPVPLSQLVHDCPPDLEIVVHRALQKSQAERFRTMEDMLMELEPICRRLQAESVAAVMDRVQGPMEERDIVSARELLRQALQVDPNNRQARSLMAKVNAEAGRRLGQVKAEVLVDKAAEKSAAAWSTCTAVAGDTQALALEAALVEAPPPAVEPQPAPRVGGTPPAASVAQSAASQVKPSPPPVQPVPSAVHLDRGDDILRKVERDLAVFIGPMARIMVKKATAKASTVDELYDILAAELKSEGERHDFLATKTEKLWRAEADTVYGDLSQNVSPDTPQNMSSKITPATVEHGARLLGHYVGPISRVHASDAGKRADSLRSFYLLLAEHLQDPAERARFLRDAGVSNPPTQPMPGE